MKRFIGILLLSALCYCLLGCASPEDVQTDGQGGQGYIFGSDDQYGFMNGGRIFAQAQEYYYFMAYQDSYLFSLNRQTEDVAPVCNKADCLHQGQQGNAACNAYFGAGVHIKCYEGQVYLLDPKHIGDASSEKAFAAPRPTILKVHADGTGYEKLVTLEDYAESFVLHRGYLYVPYTTANSASPGQEGIYGLLRYDLSDLDAPPTKVIDKQGSFRMSWLAAKGTWLFITFSGEEVDSKYGIAVDLKTLDTYDFTPTSAIFALLHDTDIEEDALLNTEAITALAQQSGLLKYWEDGRQWYIPFSNSEYIVFDTFLDDREQRFLRIFDKQMHQLNEIPISPRCGNTIGLNEEYLFYQGDANDYGGITPILCIPVSELAQQGVQPRVFFIEGET